MNRLIALLTFATAIFILIFTFPDGNAAIVVATILAAICIVLIRHFRPNESVLLTQLFVLSLLVRLVFGAFIHVFEYRNTLSGDSDTYHRAGRRLMESWFGIYDATDDRFLEHFSTAIGWGMSYLVAGIYSITGPDILSAQFFCAVLGAATVPLVYVCVKNIFNNHRASLVSAVLVGFYPAFVIWTSQLLKDGLIVFLLVLAMTMILELRNKFSYGSAAVLVTSLFGIMSLRFYIFYMMSAAMVGAFLVGSGKSNQSIVRNIVVLVVVGLGLTYVGAIRNANTEFTEYASLEKLQRARSGAAQSGSGFGQEIDVSTTEGAISAIPVGFAYVMLAPFPWHFTNTTYLITLPDMIIWWASIPLMLIGLNFSIRQNLRRSLGILIFSLMITLAYSLFQGNIGTAYRHRIQIQVFLFIFVGVGWTLILERRENKLALKKAESQRLKNRLAGKPEESAA
ncbi:MAG: phospholipid carrier-dependent glycosyltransferase [Pyrinomonadaceae bacterium]|nr:phospholipid carrier-dependent glycosyltransferase [Pyrinomonadaceae bacterium]